MKYCYECWKLQRKLFQENVSEVKDESNKGEVEGFRRHAEVHIVNENEALEEKILSWVRGVRSLKKIAKNTVNPDIRNIIMSRVFYYLC